MVIITYMENYAIIYKNLFKQIVNIQRKFSEDKFTNS